MIERQTTPTTLSGQAQSRFNGPLSRVTFIFAMQQEAQPFAEALSLREEKIESGHNAIRLCRAMVDKVDIVVSVNGKDSRYGVDRVGTESTILNTYLTCQALRPSLLVSAGTAGGFSKRGGEIGDVYLSNEPVCFHDHRIGIPGFREFGIGSYPSLKPRVLGQALGAKYGKVSTGNSLDASEGDINIIEANQVHVKEMEAAAVAQVADELDIAFLAIKSITDLVDVSHKTAEDFMSNFTLAARKLQEKLVAFVDFIKGGKSIEDL